MAPTMFIITRDNLVKFKAGLDLLFPSTKEDVKQQLKQMEQFQ